MLFSLCMCVCGYYYSVYLSLNNYRLLVIVSAKGFFKSDLLLPPAGVKLLPWSELKD